MTFTLFLALIASAAGADAPALTFDTALALAAKDAGAVASPSLRSDLERLGTTRLPSIRAEAVASSSRTLHPFFADPLESDVASAGLAFDYRLWDGGAARAREQVLEGRLRRYAGPAGLDDGEFHQLLDTYAELYLVQQQMALFEPLGQRLDQEAERADRLLSSGEITNLTAAERRDAAYSLRQRMTELEGRRADAAARLTFLTGVKEEPRLVLDPPPSAPTTGSAVNDRVDTASMAVDEAAARLRQAERGSGFTVTLSGSAGTAAARSHFREVTSTGSFGVYGLRLHLSYPLFGSRDGLSVVEARADLRQTLARQRTALDTARLRAHSYRVREQTMRKRIDLGRRSVEQAGEREQSLERLAAAGLRSESDLVAMRWERVRREAELLAVEVELWKALRLLWWTSGTGEPSRP